MYGKREGNKNRWMDENRFNEQAGWWMVHKEFDTPLEHRYQWSSTVCDFIRAGLGCVTCLCIGTAECMQQNKVIAINEIPLPFKLHRLSTTPNLLSPINTVKARRYMGEFPEISGLPEAFTFCMANLCSFSRLMPLPRYEPRKPYGLKTENGLTKH